MSFDLPRVYPITDKRMAGKETHLSILKELVLGGATLVQIRDKQTGVRDLLPDLLRCVRFARKHRVRLIIDDRCDLALVCGAAGVHLGREDLPPLAARRVLGPRSIIGYSTHSLSEVRDSAGLPVDYLGFGPVYPTHTKQHADPATGLPALRRACRASSFPVVAIGGIGAKQIPEMLGAGAQSVAVISALMKSRDPAREMERLLRIATGTG